MRRILKIKDEIAYRKADNGTMTIVSPVTDKIVTINPTASELWELVNGERDAEEISKIFLDEHRKDENFPGDDAVSLHVKEILEEFLKKEFIEQIDR